MVTKTGPLDRKIQYTSVVFVGFSAKRKQKQNNSENQEQIWKQEPASPKDGRVPDRKEHDNVVGQKTSVVPTEGTVRGLVIRSRGPQDQFNTVSSRITLT